MHPSWESVHNSVCPSMVGAVSFSGSLPATWQAQPELMRANQSSAFLLLIEFPGKLKGNDYFENPNLLK